MSIILQLVGYLDGLSGTCTVYGVNGTYNGTARISVVSDSVLLMCNFTPTQNDSINGVDFNFTTCLGDLQHSVTLASAPVIANYAHTATARIRVVQL